MEESVMRKRAQVEGLEELMGSDNRQAEETKLKNVNGVA